MTQEWDDPIESKQPRDVTIANVQYDGEGTWIDLRLSTGMGFRLSVEWLVRNIIEAQCERDKDVALLTAEGLLRWGEDHAEKV